MYEPGYYWGRMRGDNHDWEPIKIVSTNPPYIEAFGCDEPFDLDQFEIGERLQEPTT
ncbi:hypothetical protein ABIB89_003172 [Bradyrhizobium sp. JR3.12]